MRRFLDGWKVFCGDRMYTISAHKDGQVVLTRGMAILPIPEELLAAAIKSGDVLLLREIPLLTLEEKQTQVGVSTR